MEEIGLCAQKILTILGSIGNMMRGTIAPKTMRQITIGMPFGFVNHLAIFACFIIYEKWV